MELRAVHGNDNDNEEIIRETDARLVFAHCEYDHNQFCAQTQK